MEQEGTYYENQYFPEYWQEGNIMIYECIKDFHVDLIDDAGSVEKESEVNIRKGSMQKNDMTATNNMTGADLRLPLNQY